MKEPTVTTLVCSPQQKLTYKVFVKVQKNTKFKKPVFNHDALHTVVDILLIVDLRYLSNKSSLIAGVPVSITCHVKII